MRKTKRKAIDAEKEAGRHGSCDIPTIGVAQFITDLAKRHNISYVKTPNDALAEVITRLSDDDVELDDVVLLLIALERAGIIPSEKVVPLHVNYLREKFGSL